jgi:uncharacterized protein DUF5995
MPSAAAVIAATEAPYQSFDDMLAGLMTLERLFLGGPEPDRRGVFAAAYVLITRELRRRVSGGHFKDPAWVGRYGVAFGNLYRRALHDFEAGDAASVPLAWRLAFAAARAGSELVVQDLFLALNAHVNGDLPLALTAVTIDSDRAARYADHTAVNEALASVTNGVQARIEKLYDPALGLVDAGLGRLDEALTAFSFVAARENAWDRAVAIANARTDAERARVAERIAEHAAVVARLIIAPTVPIWLLQALAHLERTRDWRRCLADVAPV